MALQLNNHHVVAERFLFLMALELQGFPLSKDFYGLKHSRPFWQAKPLRLSGLGPGGRVDCGRQEISRG